MQKEIKFLYHTTAPSSGAQLQPVLRRWGTSEQNQGAVSNQNTWQLKTIKLLNFLFISFIPTSFTYPCYHFPHFSTRTSFSASNLTK